MKKRIRAGQYDFPANEWSAVSPDAKQLIRGLLCTDPMRRLTIDQVTGSEWLSGAQVPDTPLSTVDVLRQDMLGEGGAWPDVQHEMTAALRDMRVDYDAAVTRLKTLDDSSNSLLHKRRRRPQQHPTVGVAAGPVPMHTS